MDFALRGVEMETKPDRWTQEEIDVELENLYATDYDPVIDAPRKIEFVKAGDPK